MGSLSTIRSFLFHLLRLWFVTEGKLKFTQADSLFDFYALEKPEEAWTNKNEFH